MTNQENKKDLDSLIDLSWGEHISIVYKSEEELLCILVPYFKVGLENNEVCIWVVTKPLEIQDAYTALSKAVGNLGSYNEKGQIKIIEDAAVYKTDKRFNSESSLQYWNTELKDALDKEFYGLRISGSGNWVRRTDWVKFFDYEEKINSVIGKMRIKAICSYSRQIVGLPEIFLIGKRHSSILIQQENKWTKVGTQEIEKLLSSGVD